ncbi:unnamed protein product [Cyprideis torosa]|uniref:Uncharacterized protein n=1 Tax=Cyprideis torosa TaxID=163714 RepID=A0A7R8ZIP0_9CRUS|nr:unnamed protein product [Cyprideis torosa]CAG0885141.1 unnamed protein product [Cyprideis torosa]
MEEEVVSEQERVRNVEPRVLDLFWKLAEFPDSVRVSAAVSLVNIVIQKQRLSKDGSLSREADYCLKRLIRGLASSRASARLGFFACLEGFLSRVHDVDAPFTLDTISEEFRLPKNASKSEKTEAQIGKVLAITALIRSGSLFREARPGCSKTLKECVEVIISNLLMLGLKKHFLDILTSSAMAQLVEKAPEEELGQIVIPALKACVEANKSGSSPLLLWPVLLASERLPGGVSVELLSSCGLEGRSAFSEENCGVVGQAIMATSDSLPAAVHPFCSVAIRMFCERGLIVPLWTSGILSAINEDSRANKGSALPRHKAQLLLHLFAMAVEHVKKATEFTALLLPPLLPLLLSTAHHARSSSPGKPLPQGAERAALNALCRRFSAPDNPTTEKARRKVLKMLLTPPDGRVDLDALLASNMKPLFLEGDWEHIP